MVAGKLEESVGNRKGTVLVKNEKEVCKGELEVKHKLPPRAKLVRNGCAEGGPCRVGVSVKSKQALGDPREESVPRTGPKSIEGSKYIWERKKKSSKNYVTSIVGGRKKINRPGRKVSTTRRTS